MSKQQKTLFQSWNQKSKKNLTSSKSTQNDNPNPSDCPKNDNDFVQSCIGVSDSANYSTTSSEFDMEAGKTWIYPTNFPTRDYQFSIVKECLFKNTMVVLPTGLGKTFIAAVVMYNLYRWYPNGKVIFMAPTKPLVAQQRDACFQITGISPDDTVQMTGTNLPTERKIKWRTKRVFFLTPQTLSNDLARDICPAVTVKCLVIDEAHKALGNHAYCEVVRQLLPYTSEFRVLALTATPGSDTQAVKQVIGNLLISHVELRTEDSEDVKPYIHGRDIEKIVVPLGEELTSLKGNFLDIINVYLKRLQQNNAVSARNPASLSKFQILKLRESFTKQIQDRVDRRIYGLVMADFALCISLYHAYELLLHHGIKPFYHFLKGVVDGDKSIPHARAELRKNLDFEQMMEFIKENFFSDKADNSPIPNFLTSFSSNISNEIDKFASGHPKLKKLKEIVLNHFKDVNMDPSTTRIIIFSQYRDSVKEIEEMLKQHAPIIRVMSFVGQTTKTGSSKGVTQKEQLKVVQQFREGGYNTLVATCVGEEGLDIGEVDLIICYDCPKSPVRFVQRIGRTGRKRKGRIVFLVTEGKEEQMYKSSEYQRNSISRSLKSGFSFAEFYPNSPRMVPHGLYPVCVKSVMKIEPMKIVTKPKKNSCSRLTAVLDGPEKLYFDSHFNLSRLSTPVLATSKFVTLPPAECEIIKDSVSKQLSLNDWMPWQTLPQKTYMVSHSAKTSVLVDMLQLINNPSFLPKYSSNGETKCHLQTKQSSNMIKSKTNILTMLNSKPKASSNSTEFVKKKLSGLDPIHIQDNQIQSMPLDEDDNNSISVVFEKKSESDFLSFLDSMISISQSTQTTTTKETINFSYLSDSKFSLTSFQELAGVDPGISSDRLNEKGLSKQTTENKIFDNYSIKNPRIRDSTFISAKKKTELLKNKFSKSLSNDPLKKSVVTESFEKSKSLSNEKSNDSKISAIKNKSLLINSKKIVSPEMVFKKPECPQIKSSVVKDNENNLDDLSSPPLFFDESLNFETAYKEDVTDNCAKFNTKVNMETSKASILSSKLEINEVSDFEIDNLKTDVKELVTHLNTTTQYSITQLASLVDHTQKCSAGLKAKDELKISFAENDKMNSTSEEEEICPTPPKDIPSCSMSFSYKSNLVRNSQKCYNKHNLYQNLDVINECNDDDFKEDKKFPCSIFSAEIATSKHQEVTKINPMINDEQKVLDSNDGGNLEVKIKNDLSFENNAFDLSFDVDFTQERKPLPSPKSIFKLSSETSPKTKISPAENEIEFLSNSFFQERKPLQSSKSVFKLSSETSPRNRRSPPESETEILIKRNKNLKRIHLVSSSDESNKADDDDDFQVPSKKAKTKKTKFVKQKLKVMKKKPVTVAENYIINEAEVSDGNGSEDDTDGSSLDELDESFIDDNFNGVPDTEEHCLYLKSVKNYAGPQPQYKLKYNCNVSDVFSQPVDDTAPDYMLDSFCVDNDDVMFLSSSDAESPDKRINQKKKRKRIVALDSNSSSEETTPAKQRKVDDISSPFRKPVIPPVRKSPKIVKPITGNKQLNGICTLNNNFLIFPKPLTVDITTSNYVQETSAVTHNNFRSNDIKNRTASSVVENKNEPFTEDIISFDISWDEPITTDPVVDLVTDKLCEEQNNNTFVTDPTRKSDNSILVTDPTRKQSINGVGDFSKNQDSCTITNSGSVISNSLKRQSTNVSTSSKTLTKPFNSKSVENHLLQTNNSISVNSRINENSCTFNGNLKTATFVTASKTSSPSGSSFLTNFVIKNQVVLLASTSELSSSKTVINSLRTLHKAEVIVMQLPDTDYIISSRMAVVRVLDSDFFSAQNIAKIIKKVKAAKDLYEKCCVIMEKDTRKTAFRFNKDLKPHLEFSLTVLQNSSIKILHSEAQQDSAKLLYELADGEKKRNMHIDVPVHLNESQQQLYNFYVSLPHISPICALNFLYHFPTLTAFFEASVENLKTAGYISISRAHSIYWYMRANLQI